jgi:hypothetical protein
MTRSQFDHYPVRPFMRPGESLHGYFSRFFSSNGHEIPPEVRVLLESVRNGCADEAQLGLLRSMAGAERIVSGLQFEVIAADMVRQAGNCVRRKLAYLAYHCPDCMAEGLGHQALASLPLVEACPSHGLRLISSCTECGSALSWSSLRGGSTCRCGTHIGVMRREKAAAWQCNFASWLRDLAAEQTAISKQRRSNPFKKLELALELRNLVVGGRDLTRYLGAERFAPEVRRSVPARWEAALVRGPLELAVVRSQRFLRRMLPGDGSLLIELRSLRLDVILDLAKRWDEPAERSIVNLRLAVAAALDVYRVTPKRNDVIFNPKIRLLDREAQLGTLARWWSVSRLQLDIPEPDADLPTVKPSRDYLSAMGVLNLLVRAALQGRDAASLRAFNSRRLPFSVFRNVDGSIDSLVEAVGKMDAAQVSEMHWLLQHDLAKGG